MVIPFREPQLFAIDVVFLEDTLGGPIKTLLWNILVTSTLNPGDAPLNYIAQAN